MLDKYQTFVEAQNFIETQKKKNIESQKKNAKQNINREKKKIAGLNQKNTDLKIKKLKTKKQQLQKVIIGTGSDVGGGNYYK